MLWAKCGPASQPRFIFHPHFAVFFVYLCHYGCHHRGLHSLLLCSPCLCVLCLKMFLPWCHPYPSTRVITITFLFCFFWIFCVRSSVCVCSMDRRKSRLRGKKKKRRRLHSLFQNRRQRGKEKQAKGEVRRVPVRKDEKGGGMRNLSPKVIFKPRTGTLLLTSQTLKHRSAYESSWGKRRQGGNAHSHSCQVCHPIHVSTSKHVPYYRLTNSHSHQDVLIET